MKIFSELLLQLTSPLKHVGPSHQGRSPLTESTKLLHFQMVMTIRNYNANDYKIKIYVMQMMQDVMKSMKLEKYLNYTQSCQQMLYLAELNMLTLHKKKINEHNNMIGISNKNSFDIKVLRKFMKNSNNFAKTNPLHNHAEDRN